MTTIEPGMTCRLGKAKTSVQWEVLKLGMTPGHVNLSKLGGNGYVNKTARIEDLKDLQPRLLKVTLAHCLDLQDSIRKLGHSINDTARFFDNSDKVRTLTAQLTDTAERFHQAVAAYEAGVATHYPHLTKEN